jgi:hypothetical protein
METKVTIGKQSTDRPTTNGPTEMMDGKDKQTPRNWLGGVASASGTPVRTPPGCKVF